MTARYLSIDHVAEVLDVSRGQVYALINAGEFSILTVGSGSRPACRIPQAEVDEYIARKTIPRRRRGHLSTAATGRT